jgi:O-antigen ligase
LQIRIDKTRGLLWRDHLPVFLPHALTLTVGLYIFIIPFPHRTALQEICFYSSLVLLAFLYEIRKPLISFKTPLTTPFLLFAAWVLVGTFFAINQQNSVHDFFAYLIKDMALFFLVYNVFGAKKRFVLFTWLIIVSAGIFSIGGMIYFYWILKMPLEERLGLPEVGLGVNYIGYVTVLAISFAVTHFPHYRTALGTLVSFISVAGATLATLFTVTKGTMLGFASLLVILFPQKRILIVASVIVGLLILVMPVRRMFTDVTSIVGADRPMIWYDYIQVIKDHPLTGIGFGMQTYTPELIHSYAEKHYKLDKFYAPHNTFVDVAVRCGIPGFILFLYILYTFARTGLRLVRNSRDPFTRKWALCLLAVFASYLVQGFFSDMLLGIQVKYIFILLAMMAILWRWHSAPETATGDAKPGASFPAPPADESGART